MKVGDIVRGAQDNPIPSQRNSIAIVIAKEWDDRFTIMWISGQIETRCLISGFRAEMFEVINEGR